jgi:hypothetical protein
MKTYGGVGVYINIFLTSALKVSDQFQAPAALTPGKIPCAHWIGGWVVRRAGLDGV